MSLRTPRVTVECALKSFVLSIFQAHVGVGISGKEGKQAVNASDFAIAQFRFLEDLILIHGRWDFFRLSTVVLFSFYKNAVMAGMLIAFASNALYSGTPVFDQWLIAMLNFVAGLPIMVIGLFDRSLSKEYVKGNPVVYTASRRNELITVRTLLRWVCLVFVHIFILYYFTIPQLSTGGGMTSAFQGLMGDKNKDPLHPGNGEGGDLKSVGTVTFSCMIILLAYKVLYESKSLIHGIWPAFTCRKGVGEGFFSRVAYTWVTVGWLSLGFYLWALVVYSEIGRMGPSNFSQFTLMTTHMLATRTINYLILIFVPVIGIGVDVCGKLFSNMFYPTQTQIHSEIEAKQREEMRLRNVLRTSSFRRVVGHTDTAVEEP
jgi:magnesium-transporting ATPase (P-type)